MTGYKWVTVEFKLRAQCAECEADLDLEVIGFGSKNEFCDIKVGPCPTCAKEESDD